MSIRIITFSILFSFLVTNCDKNFLEKSPTNVTLKATYFKNIQSLQASLNSCYSLLGETNYYGRNFIVFTELYSGNSKLNSTNSGRFNEFNTREISSTNNYLHDFWLSAYNVIRQTNEVLEGCDSLYSDDSVSCRIIKGQALAIRALAHFDLLKTFSLNYTATNGAINANGVGGHEGIPIVQKTIIADSLINYNRPTVRECYIKIENDLIEAANLTPNFSNPFYISKEFVWGLLARVSMQKSEFARAITYCDSVLSTNNFQLMASTEYVESWSNEYTSEDIFKLPNSKSIFGTDALSYIFSKDGYADILPTLDLINIYGTNDVRRLWFTSAPPFYSLKYPGVNNRIGYDNIPLMRLSEIHLMIAESLSQLVVSGKVLDSYTEIYESTAIYHLDVIKKRANPISIPSQSTSKMLLEEILIERRKELCFEGFYFYDLKRSKKGILITDCNQNSCSIPYYSNKMAFPIPQFEISANPNMNQNEGY